MAPPWKIPPVILKAGFFHEKKPPSFLGAYFLGKIFAEVMPNPCRQHHQNMIQLERIV